MQKREAITVVKNDDRWPGSELIGYIVDWRGESSFRRYLWEN